MKDNNVKEMICGAGRKICRKTESAAHAAKLAVEIEAQKMRLSTIYERIGEAVVSGVLSEEGGEVLDDAIGFLKMSATQKYPEGMYQLAYHYYEGRGIYRDFNKARELCEELLGMELRDKLREKVNALLALLTK